MTEADRFLQELMRGRHSTETTEQPATDGGGGVPNAEDSMEESLKVRPNVGRRILAVVLFFALFLPATYIAKVSPRPSILMGLILGNIAFMVAGAVWRSGGK